MASGPITSWQIEGEKVEAVTDFLFMGSKIITVSAVLKLKDAPWRENLDSILKSRDISLLTKIHEVKTTFSPVVMYGCDSWIIRKAEH